MYTLKDVFPSPKKPYKKNFVKENAQNLKYNPAKPSVELVSKTVRDSQSIERNPSVTISGTNRSNEKVISKFQVSKNTTRKKNPEIKFKKGDMGEFLRRKEQRIKTPPNMIDESQAVSELSSRLRDIGCQTVESNFSQKPGEQRLTMIYPKEEVANQQKASGDSTRNKSPVTPRVQNGYKGDQEPAEIEKKNITPRVKTVEKEKDPYLPPGYQKGVLPRYLRDRRDEQNGNVPEPFDAECPPGHITLPDSERKETLRMLRSSFAELVNELNKMPVRTDTLRMRARKMELEKQLTKLEEGIKVFSRPKVFVRMGE